MREEWILELIDRFESGDIARLKLKAETFTLELEKASASAQLRVEPQFLSNMMTESQVVPSAAPVAATQETPAVTASEEPEEAYLVKSPIVGVFYAAPSPDSPPFVTEGQAVKAGQTLCILEAMKMMNEIEAPVSGTIRNIRKENGDMVSFDEVLFEIEEV